GARGARACASRGHRSGNSYWKRRGLSTPAGGRPWRAECRGGRLGGLLRTSERLGRRSAGVAAEDEGGPVERRRAPGRVGPLVANDPQAAPGPLAQQPELGLAKGLQLAQRLLPVPQAGVEALHQLAG